MIIYNTTFHVEDEVLNDYIHFIKKTFIPFCLNSGYLEKPNFAMIHKQYEESGSSYALQFKAKDIDTLNSWIENEGSGLLNRTQQLFGTKVLFFNTLLEEISL